MQCCTILYCAVHSDMTVLQLDKGNRRDSQESGSTARVYVARNMYAPCPVWRVGALLSRSRMTRSRTARRKQLLTIPYSDCPQHSVMLKTSMKKKKGDVRNYDTRTIQFSTVHHSTRIGWQVSHPKQQLHQQQQQQ